MKNQEDCGQESKCFFLWSVQVSRNRKAVIVSSLHWLAFAAHFSLNLDSELNNLAAAQCSKMIVIAIAVMPALLIIWNLAYNLWTTDCVL